MDYNEGTWKGARLTLELKAVVCIYLCRTHSNLFMHNRRICWPWSKPLFVAELHYRKNVTGELGFLFKPIYFQAMLSLQEASTFPMRLIEAIGAHLKLSNMQEPRCSMDLGKKFRNFLLNGPI